MMKKNIDAFVNVDDISRIVYRKDDFGVTCFRHIDVEYSYGEYIEISEKDANFQRILDVFGITDLEKEEIILFEEEPTND